MTSPLLSSPQIRAIADLLERLGGIPAERVRFHPVPGTATVNDVIEIHGREKRSCELIDGVLVEKASGFRESYLASAIASAILEFVKPRRLGYVAGAGGMTQLIPNLVRGPDLSFTSKARLPNGVPNEPYPLLVPDLAVEVLSRSNTPKEMERKRRDYFSAGVRLVWIVDIATQTVEVYTSPENPMQLTAADSLDGGDVLPGFTLPLASLFAELND